MFTPELVKYIGLKSVTYSYSRSKRFHHYLMHICVGGTLALLVLLAGYMLNRPPLHEDLGLTLEEKARKDGYSVERHEAITKDGFVLGLFRLYKTQGQPVLLLHGFGLSPESFVFNFYGKGLAYHLADAGYDIWLGCNRGNLHSRKHLYLAENQREFWDWSANEMVYFDVPALVQKVLNLTHSAQLHAIGHSQGGTITATALSIFPDLRSQVKSLTMIASPPGKIPKLSFSIRLLSHHFTQQVLHLCGIHKLADPPSSLAVTIAHYLPILAPFFAHSAFNPSLTGEDPALSLIASARLLGGISLKSFEYVRQLANSSNNHPVFFNYGPSLNMLIYHSPIAPEIDYSVIGVPVAYFAGKADEFTSVSEKSLMKEQLGRWSEVHEVGYDHDHMGLLLSGKPQYLEELLVFLSSKRIS